MKAKTKTKPVEKITMPDDVKQKILTKVGKSMTEVANAEMKAASALENSGQVLLALCCDVNALYKGDWSDALLDQCSKVAQEKLRGIKTWSKGTLEARTSEVRTVLAEHAGIAMLAPRIKKLPHDRAFIVKLARGLKYGAKPAAAIKAASEARKANRADKGNKVAPRARFYRDLGTLLRRAYASKATTAEDKAKFLKAFTTLGITGKIDKARKAK
jgi:hypothetical protein